MQLRMSPGGSILSSLRRRPLEPPSSLTVTMALRSRMEGESGSAGISDGQRTKRLSPLSRVESPVPPPMATTRRPRSRAGLSGGRDSAMLVSMCCGLGRLFFAEVVVRGALDAGVRIKQFGEARVLRQILEVGIVARLETQLSIQTQGLVQAFQRILDVPGKTVQRSQAVDHIIGLGILLEQLFEMFAGGDIVADIHQRDGIIEMLLGRLELRGRSTIQVLVADAEMNVGPVDQLFAGAGDDLLKMRLRLVKFMFLHGAQTGFVALQRLRVTRIFRHGLFRGRFLSHVQNSSCALGNGELLGILHSSRSKVSLKEWVEVQLTSSAEY